MDKKSLISIIVLVLLVVILTLFWQFFGPKFRPSDQAAQVINSQQNQPATVIVTGLHQFKSGRHIIAGEADLPTPCHVLNHEVIVAESSPEQVTINFQTAVDDAALCAQVITSARYKLDFNASVDAVIKATWNGEPAQLNLIPVAAGENLDDFDVFIKG